MLRTKQVIDISDRPSPSKRSATGEKFSGESSLVEFKNTLIAIRTKLPPQFQHSTKSSLKHRSGSQLTISSLKAH